MQQSLLISWWRVLSNIFSYPSAREMLRQKLDEISIKIEDNLDIDFSHVSKKIDNIEDFNKIILNPFLTGEKLFYRGERINDPNRRLLPTLYRDQKVTLENSDLGIKHINSNFIFDYYKSLGDFVFVFNKTMGKASPEHLYEICAFAQHYYHLSPLIDFTKSIYPSLSFALKDRKSFDEDIVLYVLKLRDMDDYTKDIEVADKWLNELNVYVSYFDENSVRKSVKDLIESKKVPIPTDFRKHLDTIASNPAPKAKLIDVPTNTRMKFQQGVFMLLTDFQLFNDTYFTKNIRDSFEMNKYIIDKKICPLLVDMIKNEAPWYSYENLMDIESAFKSAVYKK